MQSRNGSAQAVTELRGRYPSDGSSTGLADSLTHQFTSQPPKATTAVATQNSGSTSRGMASASRQNVNASTAHGGFTAGASSVTIGPVSTACTIHPGFHGMPTEATAVPWA